MKQLIELLGLCADVALLCVLIILGVVMTIVAAQTIWVWGWL